MVVGIDYWPHKGGELLKVDDLHQKLMKFSQVDGITILGGEPLQQPNALLKLLKLQKKQEGLLCFIWL